MRERERYEKRVGSVVDGRWRIDSLLGWGSTSAVYAATHRNGHRAALKILHQSLCADPAMTERFLREAGIANAIKHRAIVPIRDDGMTEEGCAYLVLELLEGETLDAIRERGHGRIALEDFAQVFEELMSAISAVHAAGVVHRDLKPQNVFITKSSELKLLDFGTARIFDRAAGSGISVQGLVIGTPAFMSPEQARGAREEVDAQSDVWSLGAMIFTLLSGEYVHAGRDAHARLLAAASKPARALSDVAPSVDDRVAAVVDRALAYQKRDRWPDVQAMRIAFRTAVVTAMPTMRDLKAFADVTVDDEDETTPGTLSMSAPTLVTAKTAALLDEQKEEEEAKQRAKEAAAAPVAVLEEGPGPAHSESEAPVTSTQATRRAPRGVPVPALVIGLGAMAAAVLLVVFFVSGGEEPARTAASTATTTTTAQPEAPKTTAAPAPSFIVISAPDEPVSKNANANTRPAPPAAATTAVPTAAAATSTAASAPPRTPPAGDVESASDASVPAPAPESAPTPASPASPAAKTPPSDPSGSGGQVAEQPSPKGGAAPGANDMELP